MEPNMQQPAEPQQIPAVPDGGDDTDSFFGFAESLEDISPFDISALPPPRAAEFDLDAIMAIDPLSEEELSSWYSSAASPVPPKPDVVVTAGHGDGAGKKCGGNAGAEGSAGRQRRLSMTYGGGPSGLIRKAMTREKLEELVRVDPKRAKRIIANRISAAKSKEKKMLHASEVQERVKARQIELASIYAELDTVGRDITVLTARKHELRVYVDAMQEESPLQFAEIEQLRKEVQHLRIKTGTTGNLPYDVQLPDQYSHQLALHQQLPPPPPQYMVPQQPQFGFGMLLPPPPQLLPRPPQLLLPLPQMLQPRPQLLPPPLQLLPPQPQQLPSQSPSDAQRQFNVQGDDLGYFNFNPLN